MTTKVFSSSFTGLNCRIIEVQADVSQGLPEFFIVGLADTSVKESRQRVRASIKNVGAKFPQTRITVNLAPAQIRKQGALFDLPIAASLLLANKEIKAELLQRSLIIGELSLSGKINRITGALPIVQHAKKAGFKKIFLPKHNAAEACFIEGIEIYPLDNLREFIDYCNHKINIQKQEHIPFSSISKTAKSPSDFAKIIGLDQAKRALSIAAAGHHSILLHGSPGCGKTILARAFQGLLSEMNQEESLETTKIFSIAGMLNPEMPIITERPFREIHQNATITSLLGGGANPKPGEISLAHNGVLFLDEIAEFRRETLDSLRQPLEDKRISINRSNFSTTFPCNFILLATMNPCPCGYKNDDGIRCICSEYHIRNYQRRLSGPLLDRFDMFIPVPNSPIKNLFQVSNSQQNRILSHLKAASKVQKERFHYSSKIHKNGNMGIKQIKEYCKLSRKTALFLEAGIKQYRLSNRAYLKVVKVARTIADLEQSEEITQDHIAEALQYRYKALEKN